ncbi:hypothetical protein TraAM80_07831 [Trypanosoma rangeli]|uniref:Uncharacterized protein n=1 Tax=Trypanosoma rangeli TaxID=5698 RepID=A0A422N3K7_TRYRA|nr:uncharacterized protein TraAM80_07831 [Trypanosoma rangeli]RNF00055.1 hypothetical protein TraAM80_07831 [Trypanosoma rangeli]|eukprot:RNF00055.1 hypothetical protein TraAM80_07831 [Trypanosoma rangeli]
MATPGLRRWRRDLGVSRRQGRKWVFRFLFALCFLSACVFLWLLLSEAGTGSLGEDLTERELPKPFTNDFFTRVSFVMDDAMATAWRTSSSRLEFQVEMWVERVIVRSPTAAAGPLPAVLQKAGVSGTLYGKSSLKLHRTKRRSLYIRSDVPIKFVNPQPALTSNIFGRNTTVALREFILLSLWEDTHRIAYRTSVDLLQQLDLIFSFAQLVELRCYPSSRTPPVDHPCASSVPGVSVSDGAREGRTLGVYLAIEPPAPAIYRRMREAFTVFEEVADKPLDAILDALRNGSYGALQKREYEHVMEHVTRITYWRQMWRVTKESYLNNMEQALEIGSRNFMQFREPRHDLSHVPSYVKNSSFLPAYRLVEKDPWLYGLHNETDDNVTTDREKQFLDMPQYMAWIAVNTILQNGDYDDEALFFGVFRPSEPVPEKPQLPIYLGLMGWDYDNVFAPCHRKPWFKASVMYCAEATLDNAIYETPMLFTRYVDILWELAQRIDRDRFGRSVQVAENELRTILHGAPGATMATFNQVTRSEDVGVRWIMGAFLEQRQDVLRSLAGYFPTNEVSQLDQTSERDEEALVAYNMESRRELMRRLSAVVKVRNSRVSVRWGFSIVMMQSATGVDLPEEDVYELPSPGMYCARVSAVESFFASAGVLPSFRGRDRWKARGYWLIDIPLVVPSARRGSAEFGLWYFNKPQPMQYPMAIPGTGATLTVFRPPVWPQDSKERCGVFVARVLFPQQGSEKSFRWLRTNTPISTADAVSQRTMIVRGFGAVRFVVMPEKREDPSFSDVRHAQENTIRGPLLFVINTTITELVVNGANITQSLPLTSVAAPPRPPYAADGLQDAKGVTFGAYLNKGTVLHCLSENAEATGLRVNGKGFSERQAVCPIFIRGAFEVHRGATLEVAAGCVVVMLPAAMLRVSGLLRFGGTAAAPIVVTSELSDSASGWRTILVDSPSATLRASFTFFTGSGVKGLRVPNTGKHHSHSAAISATNGASVFLRHSFLIELQGAGIVAGKGAKVYVEDSLVQWAQMGIECVGCTFTSKRSVWTHFPAWDVIYADNDNDAMYLSSGKHRVIDSVIAHTKDDGIDSGAKGGGGSLVVHNTIVESCMHEGVALSADSKSHRDVVISHTIVQYCQQGIESGYTSTQHTASIMASLIQHCTVGVRYGDNYHWSHCDGRLTLQNTTLAHNEVNVMNYERQYQTPKGPEYFHSEPTLSRRHWDLLKGAACGSALQLTVAPPEALVILLMDMRQNMLQRTDWEGCKDIFMLPGDSTLVVNKTDPALTLAEEDVITGDVTVVI